MPSKTQKQPLRKTLGPQVCAFIENFCLHPDGDFKGKPVKLLKWQKKIIYELYELDENGGRQYQEGLLGIAKGSGKTALLGWLALFELLANPLVPYPEIVIAASTREQARILFKSAADSASGPLATLVEPYKSELRARNGNGVIRTVAAVAGGNDGLRPTAVFADELHEWNGSLENVYEVLRNGTTKRENSIFIAITTAGKDLNTLCGRLYLRGRGREQGQIAPNPRSWFCWFEADPGASPTDIAQLKKACPAFGVFRPVDELLNYINDQLANRREASVRRYFLNQWTMGSDECWVDIADYNACLRKKVELDPEVPSFIGVDLAIMHDTCAISICQKNDDGELMVLNRVFEVTDEVTIDLNAVTHYILELWETYNVSYVIADPKFLEQIMPDLEANGVAVFVVSQSPHRFMPIVNNTYIQIKSRRLAIQQNEVADRQILSARPKYIHQGEDGFTLRKPKPVEGIKSAHIDAAISLCLAVHGALLVPPRGKKRGLLFDDEGLGDLEWDLGEIEGWDF